MLISILALLHGGIMSDNELLELERIWKHTGSVGDEADWMQGLLRAHELDITRVRCAAMLGHAASAHLLDQGQVSWPEAIDLIREEKMHLRAASAICCATHRFFSRPLDWHPAVRVTLRKAYYSLQDIVSLPISNRMHNRILGRFNSISLTVDPDERVEEEVCLQLTSPVLLALAGDHSSCVQSIMRVMQTPLNVWREDLTDQFVHNSLTADIIPWLLNRGDPVLERFEAAFHSANS